MAKRHFSFIPIPALTVILVALYLFVKPSLFYEPSWLLPITNALFVTIVFFVVAYIAMKNYRATGRIQILLLGCGVLAFGIGGVVAGFLRSVPGAGANLNVTIYNTGALIGGGFHFAAALILLAGISPEVGSKRKEFWLVLSYVGLPIFIALFTMACLGGIIPPFFIQGVGPTALRQWVLGSADILFAFSFFFFMGSYLRNREVFLYWYSLALALTSISLTAFFIQSAVGSPIGWTGRLSQYLGGIYFLMAVITAIRSAQVRRTSFDEVLTASLSPAEEKFRALAEHSPDMIERFDREVKHIYINQAGLRLYGKPAGSIIGKTIEEMGLPGPSASLLKERIQRVFETCQPAEVEHYIPTQGRIRFYQSRCVPEFGVDGTVANVLVVSHDLTERRQAEEVLRQSEERYRSLFNGMTEGFALHEIICDEKGVPCDYRFLEINPAFERLTGLNREDVVGKTMNQVLPNDDPKWVKIYGEVALTGKSMHFENYSPALKKSYEVFAYCPAPRQFGVLFMDITERKRAEEALRDNIQLLNDIIDGSPSPIFLKDRDGKFITINASLERMLGMSRQELKGKTDYDIAPKEVADYWRSHDTKVMATGKAIQMEEVADLQDGNHIFLANKFPLVNANGQVYGVGAISHDITERKRAEEELRKSRDELEIRVQERTSDLKEANEALRQLSSRLLSAQEEERKRIAGEIHDTLGACLSAIKFKVEGAVQQIGETAAVPTQSFGTILPVIQEGIEECRRMQQDLRPSLLDDLGLLATLSWFCRRFETIYSTIHIEQEIGVEEAEIPNALKIVVYRVIQEATNNIAKHSKASLVRLSLRKVDKNLELVIQDDGQGFNMKRAGSRESTLRGLGLTSMKERAELSGGTFTIQSAQGQGTVIRASWAVLPQS